MTARIHTRGPRPERLSRLSSPPRIHRAGHIRPPSQRIGARWAALPVEGSKAWQSSQPILSRLFQR